MRDTTIARNYADALLLLAAKHGEREAWGGFISHVAAAVSQDRTLHLFLESPRVSSQAKIALLEKALSGSLPRHFVLFLVWLVKNRRQMLIPDIAVEYHSLLDEAEGRVHAMVTVARQPGDGESNWIAEQLSRALGLTVIPHINVNPAILGGIVVRVGDNVMDGSVRRRLSALRSRLV
jgi:F-type H+-transporting ATPase subunit delta